MLPTPFFRLPFLPRFRTVYPLRGPPRRRTLGDWNQRQISQEDILRSGMAVIGRGGGGPFSFHDQQLRRDPNCAAMARQVETGPGNRHQARWACSPILRLIAGNAWSAGLGWRHHPGGGAADGSPLRTDGDLRSTSLALVTGSAAIGALERPALEPEREPGTAPVGRRERGGRSPIRRCGRTVFIGTGALRPGGQRWPTAWLTRAGHGLWGELRRALHRSSDRAV